MNGIQSLMQGAPTQAPQPQQAQAPQGQVMPPQNDPRLNAAMGLVDEGVPGETIALGMKNQANDLLEKAMQLMQSAERQMAMDQPPPTPPTVAEQVDKKTMEGVAGLLQRLGPGMQQRGQQAQRQQARQMVGGMPSMGAPNMQGMANGGIVGYEKGGEIEIQPMMGPPEPNMVQRAGQGLMNYGANAQESMGILQGVKAGIGVPYEERSAVMKQVRDEIAAQNQNRDPNFLEQMGRKLMDVGLNIEESKAIIKKFYNNLGKTYEEMSNGMAQGGIVGFAGPTGSSVGGMGAEGAFGDFTDRRNYMGETDEDIQNEFLQLSRDLANTDVDAAVSAESDRFKELTGADELMAERKAKSAALEAQREARFSPEETRRRRISSGLAGLAERGLGGFGAGDTAERDKISAEQIAASEASLADMDKLIEDLRELGMGQFEAEKQARELANTNRRQGLTDGQAILKAREDVRKAAKQDETTRRGQDITAESQRYVADQGLKRTSAQDRGVEALMDEAEAAGKPISEAEALRQYYDMQYGMQGVRQRGQQGDITNRLAVIKAVDELIKVPYGPEGRAYAEAKAAGTGDEYRQSLIDQRLRDVGLSPTSGTSASTTTSVDISGINPTAIQNLKDNPTAQNRAYFDQAFGVGSAAAVLGQ